MVICLERVADFHMSQLMPLPLTVSCFSKIQIGFAFLVLAYPGSPGQRAVKRVCIVTKHGFHWSKSVDFFIVENVDVSETATRNLFHEESSNDKEEDDDIDSADDSSSSDDDSWPKVVRINYVILATKSNPHYSIAASVGVKS